MESNFYFLKERFGDYYNLAREAEVNVMTKPRTSVIYARLTLEELIKWTYLFDPTLSSLSLEKTTLEAMMYAPAFKALIADAGNLIDGLTLIRKSGNTAIHNKTDVSMRYAHSSIQNLFEFSKWFYYTYVDSSEKLPFSFDGALIPRGDGSAETQSMVKALESQVDTIKLEAEKNIHLKEVELERLRTEIAQIKAQNQASQAVSFTLNPTAEAETRRVLIDVMLREMGWNIDSPDCQEFEVSGMPNRTGIGYVDYVLWGDDGRPLAVVEAKNALHDPRKGQNQAKLYADCLENRYRRRPIIFYTNGYKTWIWDDKLYPPRLVAGIYSKDELEWTIQRRARRSLSEYKVNKEIAGRPYQERAIKRVAETFEGAHRKALLVMATGTGKTRTAIAIVDMLLKHGWARRILFLADRTALVRQAKSNFVKLMPDLSCINIVEEKENIDLHKMVFSTYPTMMNKIDTERVNDIPVYSPGHFDVIIIDEAHRSVYQKYQAIFTYFDAIIIGLTATPKSEVDKNTYELFDLENHNPTDFYELDEAVKDGWLVPPKRIGVSTKFQRDGIKYNELSEEDKERYEEDFADDLSGEMPEEIDSSELNKFVFNANTVDLVLNQLMSEGIKIEGGDKIGKTIIFAKNKNHADFIKERFDILYPHLKGGFLDIIAHHVDYAQNLIDNFSEPHKLPQIAVSVDMLDTGIDIPEILNLVFFKVVRSSSKFWQMIGRGTRLCPAIFGIPNDENDKSKDKKEFLIFDYCQNFEFFDVSPDGYENRLPKSVAQRTLECQINLVQAICSDFTPQDNEELSAFRVSLLDTIHKTVLNLNRNSFRVKAVLETVDKYSSLERWENLSLGDTTEIFENITPLAEPQEKDEDARNFDLMMLRLMLAITDGNEPVYKYVGRLKTIGKTLLKKSNLPVVKRKEHTLRTIVDEQFWSNEVSVVALEKIRQDIRELIRLIEKEQRRLVYTNLEDEITHSVVSDVMPTYVASDNYRQRVETYIRENENYLVIQKLKRNVPITHTELEILENLLFDGKERGTKSDFQKIYGDKPLGYFIRSIVGLDRNAADEAFADFLSSGNLSANQNQFISLIIDFLTKNGIVNAEMLYEPPFTRFHLEGVSGIFDDAKAEVIINILHRINQNAVA
ncbi:DEAD/DEAH box helicase family protein [Bacteroides sp.]|uniref:type I restriction endonuclease subunit R n=1 Tax=Bacteroides sp. TaxID=29523 RepID=UPI003AB44B61